MGILDSLTSQAKDGSNNLKLKTETAQPASFGFFDLSDP
jgi:hypothetical protein